MISVTNTSSIEEARPHIKSNNVTSLHIPRTTYYTWCSGLLIGCTAWSVDNGRTILTRTRSSAFRVGVRPSQAFHDAIRVCM